MLYTGSLEFTSSITTGTPAVADNMRVSDAPIFDAKSENKEDLGSRLAAEREKKIFAKKLKRIHTQVMGKALQTNDFLAKGLLENLANDIKWCRKHLDSGKYTVDEAKEAMDTTLSHYQDVSDEIIEAAFSAKRN